MSYGYCAECDAELELDEPPNCYFTGQTRSCGDCYDPRTKTRLHCFAPRLCEQCELDASEHDWRTCTCADCADERALQRGRQVHGEAVESL